MDMKRELESLTRCREKTLEIGKILGGLPLDDAILILNRCLYLAWHQAYEKLDYTKSE